MSMKSLGAFGVAVLLGAVGALTGVTGASATDTVVGLHNTTAGVGACPASVTGAAWHFVAPPVSATDFVAITLTLENDDESTTDVVITSWVESPTSGHAYVAVPAGYAIDDLVAGSFVITGSAQDVRLSHTCSGPGEPVEHLTVTKTVDTSYTRTYNWDLEKTVSTNSVKLYIPGEGPSTGTVEWDVVVAALGYTDSDETISGSVTVKNDGEVSTVIDKPVDTFDVDGVVANAFPTLDCGAATFPHVLPVGDEVTCTYSYSGAGRPTGSNTASVQANVLYTSAPVAVAWGDPDTEVNKTVTVEDISDIEPSPRSDTFTWPDGGSITYSNEFDWSDYGVVHDTNCGPYVYDNTATLTGDGDVVLDTDSESVTVNVQCYTRQGEETGWANGTKYSGQSSWAMYTTRTALQTAPYVTILAGQSMPAGTARILSCGATTCSLQVNLTGGWEFNGTTETLKVQNYTSTPPSGTVKPGQFTYKFNPTGTTATVTVGIGTYYGIHLDLVKWAPDPNF